MPRTAIRALRRPALVAPAALTGVVLLAAVAWACVPVATLEASPAQAQPGETLEVSGRFYANGIPATIHFGGLDGPVLATVVPDNRVIETTVRIPSGTEPGNYVLVANQERPDGGTLWGVPSRVLVTVTAPGGAPVLSGSAVALAPAVGRAPGLVEQEGLGVGELALVAVGVAGIALFMAGMAALLAGRRGAAPVAVRSGGGA